ncbi:MAG: exosortase U, partial [Planctomycetales bacterium]
WSSAVLDLIGVLHLPRADGLELPEEMLSIDVVAGSVNFLFAAAAFALFIAVWGRRRWIHVLPLVVFALGWVIVTGMAHAVGTALFVSHRGVPITNWSGYQVVWPVLFAAIMLLILSSDRLLLFLFPTRTGKSEFINRGLFANVSRAAALFCGQLSQSQFGKPAVMVACAVIAVLGLVQLGLGLALGSKMENPKAVAANKVIDSLQADAMPAQWRTLQRVEFDSSLANPNAPSSRNAKTWRYHLTGAEVASVGAREVVISIRRPYTTWTDPSSRMAENGWDNKEQIPLPLPGGQGGQEGTFFQIRFQRPSQHAVMYLTFLNEDGESLPPVSTGGFLEKRLWRMVDRMVSFGMSRRTPDRNLYEFSCFVESFTPINEAHRTALQKFFIERVQETQAKLKAAAAE